MSSFRKKCRPMITVQLPLSSLADNGVDHKWITKSIARKTTTCIESHDFCHLHEIRFTIRGKWRDCLQAGRLLWYQLSRETTVYMNSVWSEDIDKPLRDQNDKPFRHLYETVEYNSLNDFNLMAISGAHWDVLKVRKELLKRHSKRSIEHNVHNKREITAFQILKYIKNDINDSFDSSDSLYCIQNSQLLELLVGFKSLRSDQ